MIKGSDIQGKRENLMRERWRDKKDSTVGSFQKSIEIIKKMFVDLNVHILRE